MVRRANPACVHSRHIFGVSVQTLPRKRQGHCWFQGRNGFGMDVKMEALNKTGNGLGMVTEEPGFRGGSEVNRSATSSVAVDWRK